MSVTGLQGFELDPPRRRPRRRMALIAVVVLAMAAGAAIWATRSDSPGHRLLYSETLPDGRVFQCISDGAFIGSAGSEVHGRKAPRGADGSEAGPALVVRLSNRGRRHLEVILGAHIRLVDSCHCVPFLHNSGIRRHVAPFRAFQAHWAKRR